MSVGRDKQHGALREAVEDQSSARRMESLEERLQRALQLLWQGWQYAEQLQRSVWDFAVEESYLREMGLTNNDFRWLVCRGLIAHGRETTRRGDDGRRFESTGELTFSRRTCFVLTETGAALARRQFGDAAVMAADAAQLPRQTGNGSDGRQRPVPYWDCDRREVRLEGKLVKQFKLPSPNQETILMAFQEEGWPPRIDDPLPVQPDQDPKRRLHDTIRSLNRNQKECRLRFKGDGKGEGILWEPVPPERSNGSQ